MRIVLEVERRRWKNSAFIELQSVPVNAHSAAGVEFAFLCKLFPLILAI